MLTTYALAYGRPTRTKTTNDMSDMFDPDDIDDITRRLKAVVDGFGEGYEMTFFINRNDAVDLVNTYKLAVNGEPTSVARCWSEFAKIMERLEAAINDDIESD